MTKRDLTIPSKPNIETEQTNVEEIEIDETTSVDFQEKSAEDEQETLTQEEAAFREKVFFEEDEQIKLRDGKSYHIPPLALGDAKRLMKKLNKIDSGIIISNFLKHEDEDQDRYSELLEVLLMAFKPYYSTMTIEYLEEYIDIVTAKEIIDIMIGLNGLKKSL